MRFMMLLPGSVELLEKCAVPDRDLVLAMKKFNEKMRQAGVLLAAEGLHPTSKGVRVKTSAGNPVVTDGPFTEAKEVIAGYWLINVGSMDEAVEWAKRAPMPEGGIIEIRPIFEDCDFPPELQERNRQV
jgi:hypothetical protein